MKRHRQRSVERRCSHVTVYEIVIRLSTENPLNEEDVPALMQEQWEQTGAFMEGDQIEVVKVQKIPGDEPG